MDVNMRELTSSEIDFVSGAGNWFVDLAPAVGAWVSSGMQMIQDTLDVMELFFSAFDVEFLDDGSVILHFR